MNITSQPSGSEYSFCLVTPSYAPDFERCQFLCSTVDKFIPSSTKHYIIVDRKDLSIFKSLPNNRTEILVVEEVIPGWIKRIPFVKNGWFSFKSLPIRNWLLQQIIKLSAAQFVSEDILMFVDSDVAFVRPLNPQERFVKDGKIRFYREPNSIPRSWESHYSWYETASKLLITPMVDFPAPNYIGDLITWKKDNVLKLYEHLEKVSRRSWVETISNTWNLSEYILYGMFCDYIIDHEANHYIDETYPGLRYFGTENLSEQQIKDFLSEIEPDYVTVMISAKAGIPIKRYQKLLENMN
ncbi:MAG: DUF6492 family protein [Limnospira sp. PMC 1291.21]|uniref:Uncharacterized protein n=3 Tax=Limnospira TaxID=2596745 RepID=A0A9P1KDJ2_9CYAN|nr:MULTISPECIES: DUF6492 family protein [Limnospira]EKD11221.1 hypothetical protein SPLC1_S030510 [Arthrospira platensis C1]MDC0837561.1 DUF6492 family protein [Limnoraphis robusta]MDY7052983.1 DUF6492 family protein [Limnospira fusiformis LS22]QJB27434.1 hypothetical protein HFV01_18705 [Limnospira fusiformis SAG 85.79]RAQ46893.1 hypothetical protein B9S53_05645 [Arthrospira sp. O9.13F]